jgi:beta-galactosidase
MSTRDATVRKSGPRLLLTGPPLAAPQVENEYGSYHACDYNYMRTLRTIFRSFLGADTLLFTTDGDTERALSCGSLQGLYATIDFGTGR